MFGAAYFEPAGSSVSVLLAFASVGISFLFRPLGAFIAGHLGDRVGRRTVLVTTLFMMGGATTLIGLLPTYASIGVAAPIVLVLLRIVQGLAAGGEWGGAVLMAVEHAEPRAHGAVGAFPQMGVPLGLLLASGMLAIMGVVAPGDAFLAWGWRAPFLLSVVLVAVGYVVRRSVEQSPVFRAIAARRERGSVPIVALFRRHALLVLLAALTFAGNSAAGYMTTGGYIQAYATNPDGPVALEREPVLLAVTASAVLWVATTWFGGWISDRIGRKVTYAIGWIVLLAMVFPLFALVDTGEIGLLFLGLALFTVGIGLTYGPQAAFFAELFPASVRFSGVSISYALGAILGGAFAPAIATSLVQATGTTRSVALYLAGMAVIALIATLLLRDRRGMLLGPEHEEEQAHGAITGSTRVLPRVVAR